MRITFLDTETDPIEPGNQAPRIVCVQALCNANKEPYLLKRVKAKAFVQTVLEIAIKDPEEYLCFHFAAFDLSVICSTWPDLIPLVFEVLEAGKVWDTGIRDKVLNLARHGWVDQQPIAGELDDEGEPSYRKILYGLDDLCLRRLGVEMDKSNPWRVRFNALDALPLEQWPVEATEYALDDVRVLPLIFQSQEQDIERLRVPNWDPMQVHPLTVCSSFALYLMTCQGVQIDPVERAKLEAMLAEELAPERMEILFASGVLRRPEPARPYSRQAAKAAELHTKIALHYPEQAQDAAFVQKMLEAEGILFKAAEPASKNMAALHNLVIEVCEKIGEPVKRTEASKKFPNGQVSTKSGWLEEFEHHDPRLAEYCRVQALQKLVTTELPRIQGYERADGVHVDRVYPNFDEFKETGRTSSWDPNIQNVDPRAKGCYIPEPGWVICSVDYSTIELVTFAQKCLQLFGHSVLADLICKGVDPHAYLGAQMANAFDREGFQSIQDNWRLLQGTTNEECYYLQFSDLKKGSESQKAYYKHWRGFAKPVGLGYPGGLGPKTLVTLAKSTYKVIMTVEQAKEARDVWRETFPEAVEYFDWITTECQYMWDGEERYQYVSPCGMLRANTTYCAAANGAALQTPAAEGGKFSFWEVVRACKDPSRKSILYGCRPWAWIHDEILVNIPEDRWMHERAHEVARLMREGMERVIRDVPVKAQPVLMRRWDKNAEPVFGPEGRLQVWEPATKATSS